MIRGPRAGSGSRLRSGSRGGRRGAAWVAHAREARGGGEPGSRRPAARARASLRLSELDDIRRCSRGTRAARRRGLLVNNAGREIRRRWLAVRCFTRYERTMRLNYFRCASSHPLSSCPACASASGTHHQRVVDRVQTNTAHASPRTWLRRRRSTRLPRCAAPSATTTPNSPPSTCRSCARRYRSHQYLQAFPTLTPRSRANALRRDDRPPQAHGLRLGTFGEVLTRCRPRRWTSCHPGVSPLPRLFGGQGKKTQDAPLTGEREGEIRRRDVQRGGGDGLPVGGVHLLALRTRPQAHRAARACGAAW